MRFVVGAYGGSNVVEVFYTTASLLFISTASISEAASNLTTHRTAYSLIGNEPTHNVYSIQ